MTARRRSLSWRHLVMALWLAACGGALGSRSAGGESHFLRQCGDSCGAGLECVSGVCTRGCLVGQDKCTDLSPRAVCTDESIEPGALAVCDVSCESDTDCAALGANFACDGGFCRGPILPGQQASGGSTGNAGSGGAGVSGSTAGGDTGDSGEPATYQTPACFDVDGVAAPCPDNLACVEDPRAEPGRRGICLGQSVLGACATDETACDEGFECSNGNCVPTAVNCWSPFACKVADGCPYGYAASRVDIVDGVAACIGPCVPLSHCGCTSDAECPRGAACDVASGECAALLPWQAPGQCALPFDVGGCDALLPVFAAIDGVCTAVMYGGCEGNGNRFNTLEECLSVCEGRPLVHPCPEGRVEQKVCLQCGDVGGCPYDYDLCAKPCELEADCAADGLNCVDGFCAAGFCI